MQIRKVATDRDVRAPYIVPSLAQLASAHSVRRALSVAALLTIDVGALVLAAVLVSLVSWPEPGLFWWGMSWWDVGLAFAVLAAVAAVKGLYGRKRARHGVRKILSAWTIAFVVTLVFMLAVDPTGIGARYVITWLLAGILSVAGRVGFDAVVGAIYGPEGDAPPVIVLGS
ncbi:MAG TPA: hypothetical protein VFH61_16615, partial [Thermoleophilia bacterium]|nr:hypothetical protein [Thermoleophilia bacterium]